MLHKRVLAFIVVPFVSLIALQSVSRAESVDFNLNSGHQAAAAGNHRKAIRQFNRSLYRFQGSRQAALKGLYKSHVELKNWKSAMAIVRMQSEADPFNSAHHSEHVKLAMLTGNYEVALKSLEAVEKLSGTTDSTITLRGELLVRAGKLREAGSAFDKLIALNPKNPQAYVWKAKTEQASGRIDEAYKLYLAAYTLEPTNQEYASEYVSSALQNKDHEVVKNVGLKCLDLGSNDASCYRSLGQSCLERSCFQTAAKYFASVVALEDTAFDRMKLIYPN
ncbi:MAG: tetratricopeptide repeat protein [Bdellovibrionota bacterium]